MNDVTYLEQKVPTLYTALSVGSDAQNPVVYGVNSNAFVLKHNEIVEIVLNNLDTGSHPFHLHGHQVQVIARSAANAGIYDGKAANFPTVPMRRDTVKVMAGGYVVLRFKADNPDKSPPSMPVASPSGQTNAPANRPCTRLPVPLPHRMARRSRPDGHLHRSAGDAPADLDSARGPSERVSQGRSPDAGQRRRQHAEPPRLDRRQHRRPRQSVRVRSSLYSCRVTPSASRLADVHVLY